jgi:polyhydroxyalkanoate synthase subunit PhaC
MLAWMADSGDTRIKAAIFFTTTTDFAEAGELGVFIDDDQLDLIEGHMQTKGYPEVRHMQQVFNLMRANDLAGVSWSITT